MSLATYVRDVPPRIQRKVRVRSGDDVRRLSVLGFSEFIFYSEVLKARASHFAIGADAAPARGSVQARGVRMGAVEKHADNTAIEVAWPRSSGASERSHRTWPEDAATHADFSKSVTQRR